MIKTLSKYYEALKQQMTTRHGSNAACCAALFCLAALPASGIQSGPREHVVPSERKEGAHVRHRGPKASVWDKRVLSQQNLVDAVLTDALRGIWAQSDTHFDNGEFNHSINMNRIEVQGDPNNMDAFGNAAWLLWSTDHNDEAIAFLKQGIQANPKTFYMYDELGAHYLARLHDPVSALPYYEEAVKYPCPFITWHMLAHCYEHTKRWDKAVYAWEKASHYKKDMIAGTRLEQARKELARQQSEKQ